MENGIAISDLRTERGCRRALDRVLEMSNDELGQQDIALVNLLCATGLPSADPLNIPQCLAQIDEWTEYVRQETIKGFPRYLRNPDPNKGSEAVYRLWALMHAIRTNYGIEARIRGRTIDREVVDTSLKPTGGPYKNIVNSQVCFIHGLLSPRCLGSCASNPVLFAAVGRRLGYPVKLVLSVQHIFNRWDSPSESFNMDGSMNYIGGDAYEDYIDKYRKWRPIERTSNVFHRPITPREELAAFVFTRGNCLSASLRFEEARAACKIALQISPEHPGYQNEFTVIEENHEIKKFWEQKAFLQSRHFSAMPVRSSVISLPSMSVLNNTRIFWATQTSGSVPKHKESQQ